MGVGDCSNVSYDGDRDDVLRGVMGIGFRVLSHLFSEREVAGETSFGAGITEKNNVYMREWNIIETFLAKNGENLGFLRNNIDKSHVIS